MISDVKSTTFRGYKMTRFLGLFIPVLTFWSMGGSNIYTTKLDLGYSDFAQIAIALNFNSDCEIDKGILWFEKMRRSKLSSEQ